MPVWSFGRQKPAGRAKLRIPEKKGSVRDFPESGVVAVFFARLPIQFAYLAFFAEHKLESGQHVTRASYVGKMCVICVIMFSMCYKRCSALPK